MRSRRTTLLVGLVLVVSSVVARSEENPTDGNHLLKACAAFVAQEDATGQSAEPDVYEMFLSGTCGGYVAGVVDAHIADVLRAVVLRGSLRPAFCIPEAVTRLQEIRVFVAYLKAHPEHLHEGGITLVYGALGEAWPCPAKGAAH
jgi:hypothetical protein